MLFYVLGQQNDNKYLIGNTRVAHTFSASYQDLEKIDKLGILAGGLTHGVKCFSSQDEALHFMFTKMKFAGYDGFEYVKSAKRIVYHGTQLHKIQPFIDSLPDRNMPFNGKKLVIGYSTSVFRVNFKNNQTIEEILCDTKGIGFDVDEEQFRYCENLKKVTCFFTGIKEYAFSDCKALEEVKISGYVDYIDTGAFMNCRKLHTVILPERIFCYILDERVFQSTAIKEFKVPEGVKAIAKYAFEDCTQLERIYLPKSLKRCHADSFRGCTALKTIIFPNGCNVSESTMQVLRNITSDIQIGG